MAVAGAGSPLRRSCAALASPFIAVAPQGRVQFRFKQLLDEAADPAANPSFQGIEPVIAKKMSSLGGNRRVSRVICCHGADLRRRANVDFVCFHSWRLRHLQISMTLRYATLSKGWLGSDGHKAGGAPPLESAFFVLSPRTY